jgi:gamma-tubulin complex component 4
VLDRLLHLGFFYRELDNFCVNSRNLSWINSNRQPQMPGTTVAQRSVYCRALANGITEVLAVYRSAVLQVEQSLMSDPVPVLAAVTQGLYQVNYQSTSSQMPYLFVITQI